MDLNCLIDRIKSLMVKDVDSIDFLSVVYAMKVVINSSKFTGYNGKKYKDLFNVPIFTNSTSS